MGFILTVIILFGIALFLILKFGNFNKSKFKGREEVLQVVFTDSEEKIKLLGIIPKRKTMLYRDTMPIGKCYKVTTVPFSVVNKKEVEDDETGEKKIKKELVNGTMYLFEVRQGLLSFLGIGVNIFLINSEYVEHLSDGYRIKREVDIDRWGSKFWYSKDAITSKEVENIVWKSNYIDTLGLVKDFPERLINFDPNTAKQSKAIQEEYKGQKDLKQGRIVRE